MNSYSRINNERIGWLMTMIERNQDETALEPYMQGYLSELEVRVKDARADYGCDGSHAFHSTACHACYVIRKVENRKSGVDRGDYVPLWLKVAVPENAGRQCIGCECCRVPWNQGSDYCSERMTDSETQRTPHDEQGEVQS